MPYRLLLADDSVTIQRVIELTFADEDVSVTAVGDGQQAIAFVTADPPDIVLADVGMPKRNGYEVAEFIKRDPTLAHIPVLLLTGAFEPVDEERARSVRCDGVLAKPFEPQLLIRRVRELLRGVTPSPAQPPVAGSPADDLAPAAAGDAAGRRGAPEGEWPAPVPAAARPGSEPVDEDATVRLARPPALPEDDLPLDVAALGLNPEPPPVGEASLDDYFDRLDAAFAHLTGGQSAGDGVPVSRPAAPAPWAGAARVAPEWPPAPAIEFPAGDGVTFDRERTVLDVSGPGPEAGASSSPGDDLEAAARAVHVEVPDAFSALLEAERAHGTGVVHRGAVRSGAAVVLPGTAVTQAFLDEVARLVSQRLGERAIRDEIARVVSDTAERLIREEIERLKAAVRP